MSDVNWQMELQGVEWHAGVSTPLAQDVWALLRTMLTTQWAAPPLEPSTLRTRMCGRCCARRECSQCEARVIWYQLALELVQAMNPEHSAHPPDVSQLFYRGYLPQSSKRMVKNLWLPLF